MLQEMDYFQNRIGINNDNCKLTEEQVKDIKFKLRMGWKLSVLAKDYKVTPTHISFIRDGLNWSHIE
jgi:hypothetical protein